jgi:hypothetical protein
MNQALQDVIEHRRTTNVFEPMRAAPGLFRLRRESRALSRCGLYLARAVARWVGAAKGLYDDKPQMQRDQAIRIATFGAGSLLYATEVHGLGSCPMIGFDLWPSRVNSAFSQYCWLRLVERLPMTGLKNAGAG